MFCSEMKRLGGERSEDYVGSGEHLADTEALLAVAPTAVKLDAQIYRDFIAQERLNVRILTPS